MKTFKRVVAWIVVVLSVLGILVMLGGLVGSWVVRNKVTEVTVNLLTVAETAVAAADGAVNRIDDRLDVSQDRIHTLETNITNVGEDLEENSLVGEAISSNISDELALSVTEARATAVTIVDTVFALNKAIETVNELPFINLDGFVAELVRDAADGLVELDTTVTTFRTNVQNRREERINESVDFFTGLTTEMSTGVAEIQSGLNEISQGFNDTSARLAERKVSLPRTFTMITIAVNLLLLLMGLAFVSLLLHAWSFTKNPDQSWHDLTSGAAQNTTVEKMTNE